MPEKSIPTAANDEVKASIQDPVDEKDKTAVKPVKRGRKKKV